MRTPRFYPSSPKHVPDDLVRPSARYRLQVAVVLLSLFVFVAFYLGLVAVSGRLLFWALSYSMGSIGIGTILLKLGAVFATGMLFAFLVKGLFKIQRDDRSDLVEVTEADQPRLFAFLSGLCAETGADMPKHVYLSPEVNAAVFYDHSVLSLFLPVQKNLLIGLGLVNALTMSELKAVLGHELGHFSQRSMKVGSYVYMANRIVADIVFSRDGWDDLLDGWRRQDLRIAVFAWILTGVVWAVRKVLELLFKGINFVNAALMRQMEFDADKMAVRVAGSDAIIHSLVRSRFADTCLAHTYTDLRHAADHGIYTRDLFFHQTQTADYLRRFRRDPTLGEPPPIGADPAAHRVFDPNDPEEPPPSMWASHPPDAVREASAKAVYVPCTLDDRPAWELFGHADRLREEVTANVLARIHAGASVPVKDAAEVQRFIDAERAETTFDPRYHDVYEGRFVRPGDLEDAFDEPAATDLDAALEQVDGLFGPELEARMATQKAKRDEARRIAMALGAGAGFGGAIQLRGERVSKVEAEDRLAMLEVELSAADEGLAELDAEVLRVHVALAKRLDRLHGGDRWARELRHRYDFQLGLQGLSNQLRPIHATLDAGLGLLDGKGKNLDESDFRQLLDALSDARHRFAGLLIQSEVLFFPDLRNMPVGDSLRGFLLAQPLLHPLHGTSIDGMWIQMLLGQIAEVEDKLQRLFFKSMGGLLGLQEQIVAQLRPSPSAEEPPAEASMQLSA